MFRARLASVVVAASLAAASGCSCFDHPWFKSGSRDGNCPQQPCCDPCASPYARGASPIVDGPVLTTPDSCPVVSGSLPPGSYPPGSYPPATQPRLVPAPQSTPMPFVPQ